MNIVNILVKHFSRLCENFCILFDQNFDNVPSVRDHFRPTEIFVHFDNEHRTTIDMATFTIRIQINLLGLLTVKENLIRMIYDNCSSPLSDFLYGNLLTDYAAT